MLLLLVLLDGVVGCSATFEPRVDRRCCMVTFLCNSGLESNSTPAVPELTPFTISVKSGEVGSILIKCCSSSDCSAINCEDDSLFLWSIFSSCVYLEISLLSLFGEAVVSVMPMPSTYTPPPESDKSSCCCSKPACAITASQSICVPSLAATTTAPLESIPCVALCLLTMISSPSHSKVTSTPFSNQGRDRIVIIHCLILLRSSISAASYFANVPLPAVVYAVLMRATLIRINFNRCSFICLDSLRNLYSYSLRSEKYSVRPKNISPVLAAILATEVFNSFSAITTLCIAEMLSMERRLLAFKAGLP
uniref:Secreted protein n=1 Tax=Glossina palpalis gambiensis TaxID=67801 RepID=A0A1B0B4W5_9MUSC